MSIAKPVTSRQRVIRMFARQEQDRVPRHETFWPETIARWQTEGLRGDEQTVLNLLESDLHWVARSDPVPYPGRRDVLRQEGETEIVRDHYGALLRCWKGRSGTPEHFGWECENRQIWEQKTRPVMLQTGVQTNVSQAVENCRRGRKAQKWCYLTCIEAFEFTRRTLGDVVTLIAMVEDPDWIRDIARTQADLVLRDFNAVLAKGVKPDGLWIFGDMAFKTATMCSPQMYRELIWPEHKRLADWAHAHGMKVIYHSDGNVNQVIDLYIEAGFDCLQPLEAKAGMDLRALAPRYGSRLAFFGNIDIMVLATNDRPQIEQEVRAKVEAGMATRGYLFHSDHSVPPSVSWPTYQWVIELAGKYGRYS
jgi:uroporphyrinogen decarboxylase